MKKSNVTIAIIAVALAVFLVLLWYALGFNRVDWPLDLVLGIIWVCLVALFSYIIHKREQTRMELIRRIFIAKGGNTLYNSEAGVVALAGAPILEKSEDVLEGLEYKFDIEDQPDGFEPAMIIHTDEFDMDEQEDGTRQIKEWKGSVEDCLSETSKDFNDIDELRTLLAA